MDLHEFEYQCKGVYEFCARMGAHQRDELLTARLLNTNEIENLQSIIARTCELASEFNNLSVERLPENILAELYESSKSASMALGELKNNVTIASDNYSDKSDFHVRWKATRDKFIADLRTSCEAFCRQAVDVLPFLKSEALALKNSDTEVERFISTLEEKADKQFDDFKAKQNELEKIIMVARDTAAQAGVAQHTQTFQSVAGEHSQASKRWLVAAGVFLSLTVTAAYFFLFHWPAVGEFKDAATIQRIIAKVAAISILYYAALWSAKNYRTHRHLAVLNAHRQSALKTFDAFIKAASGDEQTKNAVLLEATRCIFAPANTGYLGKDDDDAPSNRIIEIFKMVGSGSGK